MYLKSLVLKGFKSFADRSVLSLEPGITAVVGPNGSGKSNISDAVLWVLGERNAKNLRGQAMEDVIFAGSSARKSVGLAEVDLVLDNTDGTLPVDYSEVVITRRMYRSGESEYLINGSVARRMDVLDILHDSGLGTGTHSIISQGNLDSILQSKPEDRRALIEEAAGVLKHKQRKAKSARKLERMDQHLTRVKDIAAEVERQLGPLSRKAKRARDHAELTSQLSDLSIALAVDDLRTLQGKWNEMLAQEGQLEEELAQRKAEIDKAEAHLEEVQAHIRQQSANAGELTRLHHRASSAVERLDAAALLLREKRRSAQNYAVQLELNLETNKTRRDQLQADLSQAQKQCEELRSQKAQVDKQVAHLSEEHTQLTAEHRKADTDIAQLEKQRNEIQGAQEKAQRDLASVREKLANDLAQVQLVKTRQQELKSQLESAGAERSTLEEKLSSAKQELETLQAQDAQAREAAAAALKARESLRRDLDAAREEVALMRSRIKALEESERVSNEALGPARGWILGQAQSLGGGAFPLSSALVVKEGLEPVLECLLGSDTAALLIDDTNDAATLCAALDKAQQKGEVVLLSRKGASSAEAFQAAQACGGKALIAALSYPDDAQAAIERLLGDVVLCDSFEAALAAHERSKFAVRYVAPDGAVVWPSGKVVFGRASVQDEEGAFVRARALGESRTNLAQAQKRCEEAEAALLDAQEAQHAAQEESLQLSQKLAVAKGEVAALEKELASAHQRWEALFNEQERVQDQHGRAEHSLGEARPLADELEEKISQLKLQAEQVRTQIEELREGLAPLRRQAAAARDSLAEAKLSAATLHERLTYAERMLETRKKELSQLDESDASSKDNLVHKKVAQRRIDPLLVVIEELGQSARRRASSLEENLIHAQNSSSGLNVQADEARKLSRAAHDAYDELSARMAQVRVEKGRLEVQVDTAVGSIVQDCGVPLEQALNLPPLEDRQAVEAQAFKLRRRIANMGSINPDAAQEYEQLKERFDYLAAQLGDLESARRALAKIVRVIDARMKDDFLHTFEEVDLNFREIFSTLFPGGQAFLSLVDPDDLENTGVEVSAQPRGKRISKMMLMSGGEKSLTALALLFAVYRTRATPFYILDEVEAALDDSNLRRLIGYLDSLRQQTQLIMITHQRRTMEMADVLFGVSMQADGVTKVVSQRLEHALQHAE